LAPRVGTSLKCSPLEAALVGGGSCSSESATDCGAKEEHGSCVRVRMPWGYPTQERKLADNAWKMAGGGDGRCRCAAGRAGPHCAKSLGAQPCEPEQVADPGMTGADLERFIEAKCADARDVAEVEACTQVRWKPHWESGGEYAQCGAYPRAYWITSAKCRALLPPAPAPMPAPIPAVTLPAPLPSPSPTTTPAPAPAPTPPATPPPRPGSACSAHPGCSHLSGDCCPAPNGMQLGCCATPAPAPPPPPTYGSACSAHAGCAHLSGLCCPAPTGMTLACCHEEPGFAMQVPASSGNISSMTGHLRGHSPQVLYR